MSELLGPDAQLPRELDVDCPPMTDLETVVPLRGFQGLDAQQAEIYWTSDRASGTECRLKDIKVRRFYRDRDARLAGRPGR